METTKLISDSAFTVLYILSRGLIYLNFQVLAIVLGCLVCKFVSDLVRIQHLFCARVYKSLNKCTGPSNVLYSF